MLILYFWKNIIIYFMCAQDRKDTMCILVLFTITIYIVVSNILISLKGRSELIPGSFEWESPGRVSFSNRKFRPLSPQALHITLWKKPFLLCSPPWFWQICVLLGKVRQVSIVYSRWIPHVFHVAAQINSNSPSHLLKSRIRFQSNWEGSMWGFCTTFHCYPDFPSM